MKTEKQTNKKGKNPAAALCSALGFLILTVLIALCLPLTLPKVFGYHIYTVVSGSMEPAIPVGSLLYIREIAPEEVQEGDVIAYYGAKDGASVITHRVVENRLVMGEFVTKGDANRVEDMNPVPYGDLIGSVAATIPNAGDIAQILTGPAGKIAAACAVCASVLLHLLSSWLDKKGSV